MNQKQWIIANQDMGDVRRLAEKLQVSEVLAKLLMNRGYSEPLSANEFLHPSLENLSSPFEMMNMGAAVERILDSVSRNEKIMVYGDYDVDGICASITMYEGLKKLGAQVEYYVPDRVEEGYGINVPALKSIYDGGARLLITVDCGVSSYQEIAEAQSWGMDVIVTDHHQLPESIPDCIMVNPVLSTDENDKWRGLCGTGVAFKVVQGLYMRYYHINTFPEQIRPLLDLVALATVADIVPLKADNRILVAIGLQEMAKGKRPGMEALLELSDFRGEKSGSEKIPMSPTTTLLGFGLAPRLNACGRIGDVRTGLRLMSTDDWVEAREIAAHLDAMNKERQNIERAIFEEAIAMVERDGFNQKHGIIVVGQDWHPGVIGIVASRFVEKFYTPTIVLTLNNGVYKGSGRSIKGFHLQQALSQCADILETYGGHSQAAGLGVLPENVREFKNRFARLVEEGTTEDSFIPELELDTELDLAEIDRNLYDELCQLQPCGVSNPLPLFVTRRAEPVDVRTVGSENNHLRLRLKQASANDMFAIGFRKAEKASIARTEPVDLAYHIDLNVYNGKTSLQLLLQDLKPGNRPDKMSTVDRLFSNKEEYLSHDPYQNIGNADSFFTKATGVTFDNRQFLIAQLQKGQSIQLQREPDNEHDANAIALLADGCQIGYLKRGIAKYLAPNMDDGAIYEAFVADVTGSEELNYGVNLFIQRRTEEQATMEELLEERRVQLESLEEDELKDVIRHAILGEYDYREKQQEALDALMDGDNVLAILGTGRGKSAIFQSYSAYLALWKHQVTVIVYPLRALVNDQYQSLQAKLSKLGLRVALGTGALEGEERTSFFRDLSDGAIDIVLTTPEFFSCHKTYFDNMGSQLGLVVIDEAHHLASRRQGYKQLPDVLNDIRPRQVLAVTATAGDDTGEQIISRLHLKRVVLDTHVRDNLRMSDQRNNFKKQEYLYNLLVDGEKTIIYLNSRRKAVELAEDLRGRAPYQLRDKICYYHGGLSSGDRAYVENAFRDGTIQVICATSAFGEGIDIPDVRNVVLYHLSFSKEEYNQMAGRAGRDGKPATIHLLYNQRDDNLNRNILASSCPSREVLGRFYKLLCQLVVGKPVIELTNSDLAEIVKQSKFAEPNESSISGWLGIFEELGFLERERAGNKRTITMVQNPSKMDLFSSLRYQECMAELEDYNRYVEIAFDRNLDTLLTAVNRPIYPKNLLQQEGIQS